MSNLAPTLEKYFTHLTATQGASSHTIAAYRDTWRLLIVYLHTASRIPPDKLTIEHLTTDRITGFLADLQHGRGNSIRTRNARLAAIHSFFNYAAYCHPEHAGQISQVLAIPSKRQTQTDIDYLDEPQVQALLAAPDRTTWTGRRDHALLLTAIVTGLRVSELTGLTWSDVRLGTGAHTLCHGKGRKDRATPLNKENVAVLMVWGKEQCSSGEQPVFPTRTGARMSTDAVAQRLALHVATASNTCSTLGQKRITPHVLRHTTAMRMLHAGIDTSVIALWLGHESTEITQIYLHADLKMKEAALDRVRPLNTEPGRFVPKPALLRFLETL